MGYAFNSTLINVWNRLFVLCLLINYSLYCIYVSDKKCIRFFWDRKLIEFFDQMTIIRYFIAWTTQKRVSSSCRTCCLKLNLQCAFLNYQKLKVIRWPYIMIGVVLILSNIINFCTRLRIPISYY